MWFHLRYYYFYLVLIGGLESTSVDLFSRCVGLQARDVKANEDYICRRCAVKNPPVGDDDIDKDEQN